MDANKSRPTGNSESVEFVKSALAGAALGLMLWGGTVGSRHARADDGNPPPTPDAFSNCFDPGGSRGDGITDPDNLIL